MVLASVRQPDASSPRAPCHKQQDSAEDQHGHTGIEIDVHLCQRSANSGSKDSYRSHNQAHGPKEDA